MKYAAILFLFLACAPDKECKHIYVVIEESHGPLPEADTTSKLFSVTHYGEYLVCVKCQHQKRQLIGYGSLELGKPEAGPPANITVDSKGIIIPFNNDGGFYDSAGQTWVRLYPGAKGIPAENAYYRAPGYDNIFLRDTGKWLIHEGVSDTCPPLRYYKEN